MYTPQLTLKDNIIGYDNNQLWEYLQYIINHSLSVNDFFYKHKWRYAGIYTLLIPTSLSLYMNDSRLWFPLRLYSVISWFIHNKYETADDKMSFALNQNYPFSMTNMISISYYL